MIDVIDKFLAKYPFLHDNIKFLGVLLFSYIVYIIIKKVIFRAIKKITSRTKTHIDDLLLTDKVFRRVAYVGPLLIIHEFAYVIPEAQLFVSRLTESLIVFFILLSIGAFLSAVTHVLEKMDGLKDKPIKGYVQVVKIITYSLGVILLFGVITGTSVLTILGGLSLFTAVLLLVFRDTILSFVASIQIASYDLVKVGDWVEVPKFGADGDVIDLSLNVVKVQNWDKTITVIPTYKLLEESFKNWRGMTLSGGRRIKRNIYVDIISIRFLSEEDIAEMSKITLLKDYLITKQKEITEYNTKKNYDLSNPVNGRRLTNVGTFRAYLKAYLEKREDINKDMTFMVRQLQPAEQGLPIEIYVFTTTTSWVPYEEIQADIFDHIFAIAPQFGLRLFQKPTGADLRSFSERISG
ncbi:MAG: mechanosensitive ion channel family protein [Ignavibacteriales bacterium]|nr:mechanosensitive ion channel family protein [Ignavibacteriales bacterium]MCF8305836.1 mechanosensitive ion channel family protein [Ignavibacteriales bacterium]MCF8315558.1 mechanosensitive ion channel family protein [Ignavibacteriales bacterium]MCF8436912.1 mechanosensitive ion channel family protein [Ignavibacteriales bacterium]